MMRELWEKKRGLVCATGVTVVYFAVLLFFYQPLFAMNDDMMFESVFSGSYLRPYARTYYFSSILGALFSLLYRLMPRVPWLGLGYLFGNAFCFGVIQYQAYTGSRLGKGKAAAWNYAGASLLGLLGMTALCFSSFVLMHYTLLAALFGGTGLFLIAFRRSQKQYALAGSLILFCYLIRENVFFMLCPFLAVLFLYLILEAKGKELKEEIRYSILFGGLFLLLFVGNRMTFSGKAFEDYLEYNQLRTKLYDYLGLSTDEQALRYYDSIGISPEELECFRSYDLALIRQDNSGLSELSAVVAHENQMNKEDSIDFFTLLNIYLHRFLLQKEDLPWNLVAVALYVAMFVISIGNGKFWKLLPIGILGVFRSLLWMYLLHQGRYPQRVTLSLYWMEIAVLVAFLFRALDEVHIETGRLGMKLLCIFLSLSLLGMAIHSVNGVNAQYRDDHEVNSKDDLLMDYIKQHPDQFYFLDVYAVVNRTQKALVSAKGRRENYMYAGGWMVRHPLYLEKLDSLFPGAENAAEILLGRQDTYFVIKENVGLSKERLEMILGVRLKQKDIVKGEDVVFQILEVEK